MFERFLKGFSKNRETNFQSKALPRNNYTSARGNKVEMNKQFKRAAPMYFILDKISREVGRTPLILNKIKNKVGDLQEFGRSNGVVVSDEMYLVINPNIFMDNMAFNRLLTIYWHTNGAMVILKDRGDDLKNPFGEIKNLFPINPTWIQKNPSQNEDFYQVMFNNEFITTVHKDNLIVYRNIDIEKPYSDYYGSMQAISDEIAIVEKSSSQIATYFENNMTPDSIVHFENMPEKQAELQNEKWINKFGGYLKRKIPLFTGFKVTVTKLQSEFKDMELKDLRKEEWENLERKYNVVFNLDKANRSTALIVKQEFYDNQVIPILDIIKSIWNRHILKDYGQRLYLDYVDPSPKDIQMLAQLLKEHPNMATKARIAELGGWELESYEDASEILLSGTQTRISLENPAETVEVIPKEDVTPVKTKKTLNFDKKD